MIRAITVQLQCLGTTSVLVVDNRTLLLYQQGLVDPESACIIFLPNYFCIVYHHFTVKSNSVFLFCVRLRCSSP